MLSVALGELGAGLVASPLLASTLAAGTLLRLGDEAAAARLLPGIASGEPSRDPRRPAAPGRRGPTATR